MQNDEVQALLVEAFPAGEVSVSGDGYHYEVRVVCDSFAGKTPVQKQKMVYACLQEQITSGALHAVSIKAYTPQEWEKAGKLQVL